MRHILSLSALVFLCPHFNDVGTETITSLAPDIPMGLFLSIDPEYWRNNPSWFIPQMKTWLDYICRNHRDPAGPNQYINDLAIPVIAVPDTSVSAFANPPDPNTNDTLLWYLLEPILPYFPGGNGSCQFDRVFIGTFGLDQTKGPNGESILESLVYPDFRANYLARQKAIAQQFADKVQQSALSNVQWEWYVIPEMCLDYVNFDYYGSTTDPKYTESWTEYVSKHIADLNSIRSGRHFFWSPMFDNVPGYYPQVSLDYIQDRLKYMFNTIASNLASSMPNACSTALNCPFTVGPQDHVGLGSLSSVKNYTKEDAIYWWDLLKPVFPFKNLTINVENFIRNTWPAANTWPRVSNDSYHSADCEEVKLREQYYVSKGYQLGPAYAIHSWYDCNHPGQLVCDADWTLFKHYCYKKFHWGKTWTQANETCVQNGGQLVSIHSKAENDFVVSLNRDSSVESSVWIGYFDPFVYTYKGFPAEPFMGTDNNTIIFRWSDNKPTDYLNWTPGWPTSIDTSCSTCGTNCAAIYPANGGGQWGNAGCDWYAGAFVCKKSPTVQ